LILLHGCKQTAEDILELSALKEQVDKHGFYIVIPEQHVARNAEHCWNWFLPENQTTAYYGEPALLRDLTINLFPIHAIDPNQIYVVGMSSGAGMAINMFSLFPDSFAGIVSLAGIPFGVAYDVNSAIDLINNGTALTDEELGKRMYQVRPLIMGGDRKVLLVHGDTDTRVDIKNSESLFGAFKVHADFLDDGKQNDSVDFKTSNRKRYGSQNAHSTTEHNAVSKHWSIRYLTVHGMGHQWPGSKAQSPHADPMGPSLSEYIINFLGL
jgi:poly(hydroxyalkanoate) depolymerase family esterase